MSSKTTKSSSFIHICKMVHSSKYHHGLRLLIKIKFMQIYVHDLQMSHGLRFWKVASIVLDKAKFRPFLSSEIVLFVRNAEYIN